MKLQSKLLLVLLPLGLAGGALAAVFAGKAVDNVLREELAQRALSKAAQLSAAASSGVLARSEGDLLPILQTALAETKAAYALAVDNSGTVLAHTNVVEKGKRYHDAATRRALGLQIPSYQEILVDGRRLLDVSIPVAVSDDDFIIAHGGGRGARLGILRIGLPMDDLLRSEARIFGRIVLTLLGIGAILLLLLLLSLRNILLPLHQLARSAAQIGRGQYGGTVPVRSKDEIGEFTQSFNRMSESFDRVLRSMVDVVIVADSAGKISAINRAALDILGYSEAEVLGEPARRLFDMEGKTDGGGPFGFLGSHLEPLLREGLSKNLELSLLKKDGQKVSTLLSGSVLKSAEAELDGVILVAKDLTENTRLEMMLIQSEKLSAVGRLAGGVAHDFNNLLTAILGYSGFVLDSLPAGDPNRADVEEIEKAAERAASLTRQLLAFSRKQVLRPVVLDINALAADMEPMLRRLIGEDVALELDLCPGLFAVKADKGQIEQVLLNLAVNSRDAMPLGGKLTIATANVEVAKALVHQHGEIPPGSYAMIAVADTGSGLSAEVKAHLFEPFFTTKGVGRGTGLGLATIHGIVRQSGGHIAADSAPDRGTTFKVYFPASREAAPATAAAAAPPAARGNETILLVEDDASARGVAERALRMNGYRVLSARGPEEALRFCRNGATAIDLVLTDVVMPGMNGLALAKEIAGLRPRLKTIFMSGYTDHSILKDGLLPSGMIFIPKPFSPESLVAVIRRALQISAS